mmetsp:Transcript_3005/g.6848  ORF Transcript_3005/g.6848 Transcript_3005/m.6848 type:complete len:288 (+) Transcript_3005:906-1769(+)
MQSQSQHDDARLHLRKLSTSEIARLQLFPTTHQHERQQTKSEFGAEHLLVQAVAHAIPESSGTWLREQSQRHEATTTECLVFHSDGKRGTAPVEAVNCQIGAQHIHHLEGCGAAFAKGAAAAAVKTQEQHRFSGRLPVRFQELGRAKPLHLDLQCSTAERIWNRFFAAVIRVCILAKPRPETLRSRGRLRLFHGDDVLSLLAFVRSHQFADVLGSLALMLLLQGQGLVRHLVLQVAHASLHLLQDTARQVSELVLLASIFPPGPFSPVRPPRLRIAGIRLVRLHCET